jgi:molybdopterin-guanine dinucleotide biosynthesis protein A
LLEHVVAAVEPCVARVVLLGAGEIPKSCQRLTRLADPPGLAGPLAGILAAMRWKPDVTWLIAACDLPLVTPAAINWLLEQRAPGRVAVLPRASDRGVEPLLAVYEPQAREILEELAASGYHAPHRVAEHDAVFAPTPPADLVRAWRNVNTPGDLEELS